MKFIAELIKAVGIIVMALVNLIAVGIVMYGFSNGSFLPSVILVCFTIAIDIVILRWLYKFTNQME